MPDGPRYKDDFYAWTQHQAQVVRTMPISDNRFDREHVAEEIEDSGKSARDAVRSQIRRNIEHLLKLACSPVEQPRVGWTTETLRRDVEAGFEKSYAEGRRRAVRGLRRHVEPGAADTLPQTSPYSLNDICRDDWYSDLLGEK